MAVIVHNGHNRKEALRNKQTSPRSNHVVNLVLAIVIVFLNTVTLINHKVASNYENTMHSDSLGLGPPVPAPQSASNSGPVVGVVHIVGSRFMQGQGDLTHLAAARLELFETFCLPTMISQTTQDFVWMVRTDPALDALTKRRMIELLAPYPNYLLVASNDNSWDFKGWFEDDSSQADFLEDSSKVWSGDADLVREARKAIGASIVLETNLDADDGLNVRYVERIQEQARASLGGRAGSDEWKYWCATAPLQWHPATPELPDSDPNLPGYFLPDEKERTCKTPGLTVGVGRNTRNAPRKENLNDFHRQLLKKISACSENPGTGLHAVPDETGCVYDVNLDPRVLWPNSIRARTTTSNGMRNIGKYESLTSSHNSPFGPLNQTGLWGLIQRELHINPVRAKITQEYLRDNSKIIAMENLKGQCRNGEGYSCKQKAKQMLLRITKGKMKWQGISTVDESPPSTPEDKGRNNRGTKSEQVKEKTGRSSIANERRMIPIDDEFNDLPISTLVSMLKGKGMKDNGTKSELVVRLALRQRKAGDLAAGRLDLATLTKPELRELKNSLGAGVGDGKTSRTMPEYIRLLTKCLA